LSDPSWLVLACGLIAFLYSTVGHGGASGYLAVLALAGMPASRSSTLALVLNLAVAGISFCWYQRTRHFEGRLIIPFLIGSVPLAFLGGSLKVAQPLYDGLIGAVLTIAAIRLLLPIPPIGEIRQPGVPTSIATGAGIGLVSGIVGVGGGIFLSPVLLLARWADTKRAAAVTSLFIVANSIAGLAGRFPRGGIDLTGALPLLAAGTMGAMLGARWGATALASDVLRRLLGVVLLVASAKLIFQVMGWI